VDESRKNQLEIIETHFSDLKDRLRYIETLLDENGKLFKRSLRRSREYHIDSIGLTGMVAGMGLIMARPDYAISALVLFFCGFILTIVSHFLP